jgi:hypothetical protein
MKKQLRFLEFIVIAAVITFTWAACDNDSGNVPGTSGEPDIQGVSRVDFSGPTETVTLADLKDNDIYLVKVNTSGYIVKASNTGSVSGSSPSTRGDNVLPRPYVALLPRMGYSGADEFRANPPPIVEETPRLSRAVFVPPVVGNKRLFWVESYLNSGIWVQKPATLRAVGKYGNVWVMDENYGPEGGNEITTSQAQALADKFDLIYPIETNLLGFEYGGGPDGDGGKDGDPRIQILVYSIVDPSGVVQAAGFFHAKDFYEQNQLSTQKTNFAEMFYIDASQVNDVPDYIYSILVHEFQHMINFNMKFVKNKKSSQAWYDEMLSMMTEDVISPLIGIDPTNWYHKIQQEIPTFLINYYTVGITEWNLLDERSYAKGYAFGAYLLRNYGGASLLKEILANNSTNIDSVTAALKKVGGSELSFEEALRRFGEAIVFSGTMPSDVMSFDKTVTKTIGSYTYTATKFDVWTDFGSTKPMIFGLTEQVETRPYSLTVHQDAEAWINQTGDIDIILKRPNDPKVEFYLMVK